MSNDSLSGRKALVIVESPTKVRTLQSFLGAEYEVVATVGHIRELSMRGRSVDPENDFSLRYRLIRGSREIVETISAAAERAAVIYLATDPDREGEAIAVQVVQVARLGDRPCHRVVFHEITPEAVLKALEDPRSLDDHLVHAQQAREALDWLVGKKVSRWLSRTVARGLSAGRVQTVALRMTAERERARTAFISEEYWTIDVIFAKNGAFKARLVGPVGKTKTEVSSEEESARLVELLNRSSYRVSEVKKRPRSASPKPPFTTSTLQQDASRLGSGFTAERTMSIAQSLYEGVELGDEGQVGLITYMRTDSTNIAGSAIDDARAYASDRFGPDYVPDSPRTFRTKQKAAQEGHEAIRPTSVAREPDMLRGALNRDQHRLYTLIWQRFVASQMADAAFDLTTIEVEAQPDEGSHRLLLRATESVLRFLGYRQVYQEEEDDETAKDRKSSALPSLAVGDALLATELQPEQHFTAPPPRYTEATLVKALEENGIGRPSTYASIMAKLRNRGYIRREARILLPQDLGLVVNDMLIGNFPHIFDVGFTAEMEENLGKIAKGDASWTGVLREFYESLERALEEAKHVERVQEATDVKCGLCGKPMTKRWSRHGQFLICLPNDCCKGSIRPLLSSTELSCLEKDCGGGIVELRTLRRQRPFYGCSNYPDCTFRSWSRPLPEPCPSCSGRIEASGRGRADGRVAARCTQCDWSGEAALGKPNVLIPGPTRELRGDYSERSTLPGEAVVTDADTRTNSVASGTVKEPTDDGEQAKAAMAVAEAAGCRIVDKRPNGSLWIVGGPELANELEPLGLRFAENGGRASKREPAWYLSGEDDRGT